jgi:hypothetical protein
MTNTERLKEIRRKLDPKKFFGAVIAEEMLLIIAEELCKMNEFLQKIPHNNI